MTQDFISTATGIDEAMAKIEKQEIVEHLSENSLLVQLKYAGASTDEPLLNELYKHYQVMANILYGNIEILDGTPVGELVVVLSGEKAALAGAQEAIRQAGVQLKVLKEYSKMESLIQTYLPNVYKMGWAGQAGWERLST